MFGSIISSSGNLNAGKSGGGSSHGFGGHIKNKGK
jgi:hypothetical protein